MIHPVTTSIPEYSTVERVGTTCTLSFSRSSATESRHVPGTECRAFPQSTLVGTAERRQRFANAITEVANFATLPIGFDDYDGLPATDRSVQYVRSLLSDLIDRPEISAPRVTPISTGAAILWKKGQMTLSFEVQDDSVLIVRRIGRAVIECAEDESFDVVMAREFVKRFHQGEQPSVSLQ